MSLAMLDTTVLSNFSHVQRPEFVAQVPNATAATTPAVLHELQVGEALSFVPTCDWRWLPILTPTASEQPLATELRHQLDVDKAECLTVALMRGYHFLTDDRTARQVARHRGVVVSGTLGLLIKAVNDQVLTIHDADKLLSMMIVNGYRSPVKTLLTLISD